MADSPLIDIFDLCVERLAAGETVEDCLRDYPEYANELRGLLETGFLVFQAQADPADEQQAQAHTRSRIEQALQTDFAPHRGRNNMPTDLETEKPKNRPFTIRRSVIWIGASAAAVFIFTLGFAFATASAPQPQQQVADAGMYMTNVYLRDVVATEAAREVVIDPNKDSFIYTATAYVRQATQTAIAEVLAMPVSYIDAVNMTEIAIGAEADLDRDGLTTNQEKEFGTDPDNYDTDGDDLSDGEEVNRITTNPLDMDTDGDDINDGDELKNSTNPLSNNNVLALTATKFVAEITQTAAAQMELSGTPIAMLNPPSTATPLPTLAPLGTATAMPPLSAAGGDTAITGEVAATSVALYLPMTATLVGMPYNEAEAGSADGRTDPAEPLAPVVFDSDTTTLEREASSDEFKAVDGVDSIVPYDGPAITLDATFMPGTTSSDVLAGGITPEMGGMLSPVNMQQQLDPMKAGEIDDNAEWDTYTEFRRNYIGSYGTWTILDYDISGRRIIKVVDAIGNPILGAHVEVFMDQVKVSDSYTYATGMTLFFPNALESTKRRDLYEVVVSADQYQTLYTLDLRSVGDVLEIQLPIVIIRAPQPPNAPNIASDAAAAENAAASENATAAAQNAQAANQNATAASENATAAYAAAETATFIHLVGTATALPPIFTPTPATR